MRHILSFDIAKDKSVYCFIDELRNVIIDATLIEHKKIKILTLKSLYLELYMIYYKQVINMVKKLILIDGNNLMFRSYYATAYTGNMMKNSKGVPTNALFGFVNMMNKIISEENPSYMAVAFDIGKNFRKEEYDFYKEGRIDTPEELKIQMPIAREILDKMGIKHFELAPYEADDIVGTIVKMTEADKDFASVIVSSDKDLLQLISDETEVKLLKQNGFIRYNHKAFVDDYKIEPIKMIDLKALMGDQSDNIPGVKGIGEKTALKLLQEYKSLENLYDNIDNIKGKTKEKLVEDKEMAFISKKIATIYRDVPLNIVLEDLKYEKNITPELLDLFKDLEFFSFLKNMEIKKETKTLKYSSISTINNISLDKDISIDVMLDNENYHLAKLVSMSISDSKNNYIVNKDDILNVLNEIKNYNITTYDAKKIIVNTGIIINCVNDIMISAYLLNLNTKDDLAYLANQSNNDLLYYDNLKKNNFSDIELEMVKRSRYLFSIKDEHIKELENSNALSLYQNIEMPLLYVLADMEKTGIICNKDILKDMSLELDVKLELLTKEIYNLAGIKFNISSPKQLGEVLFEKLEIAKGKKNKTGYKTDIKVLEKLVDKHPIIEKILEYRNLSKLKSTYIEGLSNYILSDGKIHTIYKQTLTRTGRLSSTDPNLQNIPVREELGRNIRKAFLPENDYLLSADYSQVELRVMASLSNCKSLIVAFQNDEDIHTHVASEVFNVPEEAVTKQMRRCAKAVIFGIIYGISGFGLGENLHISKSEADDFIEKFHKLYPEVKNYTDTQVSLAKEKGYVTTLFGRTRVIEEINNPNYLIRQMGERMAMNTPIQGTSADIMKLSMINVYNRFMCEGITSKILLQVHDEIIVDCKNSELDKIKKIVKEEMENVYKLSVPLKVEIDTGINWYEAK